MFESDTKKTLKTISIYAALAHNHLIQNKDPLHPDTIKSYFQDIYQLKGNALDENKILEDLSKVGDDLEIPFESIARKFRMIESLYVPVIVPFGKAASLVEQLRSRAASPHPVSIRDLARKLQSYTVGIPEHARDMLLCKSVAEAIGETRYERQFVWLTNGDIYRPKTGLDWGDPTFRDAIGLIG